MGAADRAMRTILLRGDHVVVCPHCTSEDVERGGAVYVCRCCAKTFTLAEATIAVAP